MKVSNLTRRGFAGALGAAIGATFLDRNTISAATTRRPAREGLIRLNANENPYGPSDPARAAISRSLEVAARYPDELAGEVRRAIAGHHGVSEEQVLLGCGSSQILQMADAAFLTPDRTIIAAEPTFEAVLAYAATIHAEPVKVPLTAEFRHDLARMKNACGEKTGLVYICNPNNPTGTIVRDEDLRRFLMDVPSTAVVLVDEAYHHFVEDSRYKSAVGILDRSPNLVVARTFSKIYGLAGMRLGYAVASSELVARLEPRASWDNVNAAVLSAALASLDDPALVPDRRKVSNDTRRALCAELARDGRRYIPSETNFLMIDVDGEVTPIIRSFRDRKILVGRKFPSMPNWLRITIGTPSEMEAFLAALREIVPARRRAA